LEPLISILIPAFNAERYIAATIRSALGQSWSRKEIIVVDDGSTDQTLAVARGFASKQVLVVRQPNQGAAVARNRALALSQGDYVQWLDADDLLAPEKLSKQLEPLQRGPAQRTLLCSAFGTFLSRPGRARFSPTPLWQDLSPIQWMVVKMETGSWMQTGAWLVSRELTEAAGPWDTRLSLDDDGEYFCRVVLASNRIRFVRAAEVYYRKTPASLSCVCARKLDSQFLSAQLQIEHVRSFADNEQTRTACLRYLQDILPLFYPERADIVEKARELATALGRELQVPRLPWKYAWIQKLIGWTAAKRIRASYNRHKASLIRACDRVLCQLEGLTAKQDV
jgi:glycosyltransferase involved in cell wall biosynthesis